MTKAVWGAGARIAGLLIVIPTLFASASCGDLTRQGTASSYLIVTVLEAASGADPGKFQNTLFSDVITIVDMDGVKVATTFADLASVTFQLGMKDAGAAGSPTAPTSANAITLDRYHVRYVRADGRNVEGVDVPYAFDGGMTFTVSGNATGTFELVRHTAKHEAPLQALGANGVIINTIAEVTFYGHDQTGRSVSVTSKIAIEFGNFGDPQ